MFLPILKKALEKILSALLLEKDFIVFLDCPLLFENHIELFCSETLSVFCDEEKQLERLMKRDKIDLETAKNQIKSQMPMAEKLKKSTFSLDNSFSSSNTNKLVKEWLRDLQSRHRNYLFPTILSLVLAQIFFWSCLAIYLLIKNI